jgi:hypothetical protein
MGILLTSQAQSQAPHHQLTKPVPASVFSAWPCLQGPRLVDALEFLVGLLHGQQELIPANFPYELWRPQAAAAAPAGADAAQ